MILDGIGNGIMPGDPTNLALIRAFLPNPFLLNLPDHILPKIPLIVLLLLVALVFDEGLVLFVLSEGEGLVLEGLVLELLEELLLVHL